MGGGSRRPRCPSCGSGDTVADEVCVGPLIDDWSTGWTCRRCGADSRDLFAICVLEVMDGRPPQAFVRARLDTESEPVRLELYSQGSRSPRRLPLAVAPAGFQVGHGLEATWIAGRLDEDNPLQLPILVRPILQSDASWLSSLGVRGLPTREILEDVVRLRYGNSPPHEELVVLHLLGLSPHALAYRIRSRTGDRLRIWDGGGWRRSEDAAAAPNHRLLSIATEAQRFPWTRRVVRSVSSLLDPRLPGLAIRPEHLRAACDRIARDPRPHDRIAFLMMGARSEQAVSDEDLGEELATILMSIGQTVQAAYETQYGEEPWGHEDLLEEDPGSGTFPTGVFHPTWEAANDEEIARLRWLPFSTTAGQLIRSLDHFAGREEELASILNATTSSGRPPVVHRSEGRPA